MIALNVEIEHFMKHQLAENVLDVGKYGIGIQVKVGVNDVLIAEDGWFSITKES